ncbi:hypothetical protein [Microcoleus vaginatus]
MEPAVIIVKPVLLFLWQTQQCDRPFCECAIALPSSNQANSQ